MTFGVLFSNVTTFTQMEMWRGINEFTKAKDIHLIGYMGCYQSTHYDFTSHLNTCFDAIYNSKTLDGVILFSGYIPHHIGGNKVYDAYVAKIPPHIKRVSLSYEAPGVPSILADNVGGIFDAVDHLINVHNKKNIVFITGPKGNQEAEGRFKGYQQALAKNSIPYDSNYVIAGDFSVNGAQGAVIELLEKRKIPFDAIVASNDVTAITVLNELKSRNIQVPNEVSVTGFDDDRKASTFIPSVSTARQDFFNIGFTGAQTLFDAINGASVDLVKVVPSIFVTRQSCGCFKREFISMENQTNENDKSFTPFVLNKLVPLFNKDVTEKLARQWVGALAELVTATHFQGETFLSAFEGILLNYSHISGDYFIWQEVISLFMVSVQRYPQEIENEQNTLEALLHAQVLVHEIAANQNKVREYHQSDIRFILRRITSALVLTFDIHSLADEIYRLLPEVNIDMALVCLYHVPFKNNSLTATREIDTVFGYDGESSFFNKMESNFKQLHNIPEIEKFYYNRERRTLFCLPLFFKNEELGMLVLPYDPELTAEIDIYETLRVNISTAVKGAELLTRIQSLSISDELTGLFNRRGFFQQVYTRMDMVRRIEDLRPIVLFMDMDGLKFVNDNYGHHEGDRAIQAFAKILQAALRKEDIIGRVGGDEFIVFSTVKNPSTTSNLITRLREKMDEFNESSWLPYKVQCSIGHVVLEEVTRECFESAILKADAALYEEKMEKRKKGLTRGNLIDILE